jgi:hypothetical protein
MAAVRNVRIVHVNGTSDLTQLKAGYTILRGIFVSNSGGTSVYMKLFDSGMTAPTVGTTTPNMTMRVPSGTSVFPNYTFPPDGIIFTNGLWFAATDAQADSDTGYTAASGAFMFHIYFE